MGQQLSPTRRIAYMLAVVAAGEAAFALPFVFARIFRPTLLDVFGITNLQLGTAFSLYGIVAMLAYFPGGPLADYFNARRLMSSALLITALGGVYYVTFPSPPGLNVLFGFWGMSTILLFWSAMIRATRDWGGEDSQGQAFGLLDGGRGLFAALLASVTVALFAALLPDDVESATLEQRTDALRKVLWVFVGFTAAAALPVWFFIPERTAGKGESLRPRISLDLIARVLSNRAVWLQGTIVVCAYTAYKGTDDFGLYARDTFEFNDVQAATLGTVAFWVRPFAAFGAGLLADRISASRVVLLCFSGLAVADLVLASRLLPPSMPWVVFVGVASTCAMLFGLRGIYFALFGEAQVPAELTGTAAGVVSVVGYTPDVFMGPIMGYLTDTYPGPVGHQYFFGLLAGFATIGVVATLLFKQVTRRAAGRN